MYDQNWECIYRFLSTTTKSLWIPMLFVTSFSCMTQFTTVGTDPTWSSSSRLVHRTSSSSKWLSTICCIDKKKKLFDSFTVDLAFLFWEPSWISGSRNTLTCIRIFYIWILNYFTLQEFSWLHEMVKTHHGFLVFIHTEFIYHS